MTTPLKTSRLEIPYPPENSDDWWDIENGVAGRMDMIDRILYAAMENQSMHWVWTSGTWGLSGSTFGPSGEVDVVVKSPAGGTLVFAPASAVTVSTGDYVYMVVPERPLASTGLTGVLVATSTFLERSDRCLIGFKSQAGPFVWIHPALESQEF